MIASVNPRNAALANGQVIAANNIVNAAKKIKKAFLVERGSMTGRESRLFDAIRQVVVLNLRKPSRI